MFEVVCDSVGKSSSPDRCYELWGVVRSFISHEDLRASIFCNPETHCDLFDLMDTTEMVDDIYTKTPLEDLQGLYAVFHPQGLDGIDHFHLMMNFV